MHFGWLHWGKWFSSYLTQLPRTIYLKKKHLALVPFHLDVISTYKIEYILKSNNALVKNRKIENISFITSHFEMSSQIAC